MRAEPIIRAETVVEAAAVGGVATWWVATALSQTPNRRFDHVRRYDRSQVTIPNWRFFAPNPAEHDQRVAYRVRFADGAVSPWHDLYVPARRRWNHALFYPSRRRDKGIHDLTTILLEHMATSLATVERSQGYRVLLGVVRRSVQERFGDDPRGVAGMQFLLARDAGYEESIEPELIFASRYEPVQAPPAPARADDVAEAEVSAL